jgi:CRISPR-associated protein Cmr5
MAITLTLEQKRAQDAWKCAQEAKRSLKKYDAYVNAAKGLPALIMNSGLMQVMAFMHEKASKSDGERYALLEKHLLDWLSPRFQVQADFNGFITTLMAMNDARKFQAITSEAFAWLKWLRQIAPAVEKGN